MTTRDHCDLCGRWDSALRAGICPDCVRRYCVEPAPEGEPLGYEAADPERIPGYRVGEPHPGGHR